MQDSAAANNVRAVVIFTPSCCYCLHPIAPTLEWSAPMLLSGGNVLDPAGKILPQHSVLIEEGRVKAVGPDADFDGFAGALFDTSGCTVMPGLIDCHVHLVFGGEGNPRPVLHELSDAAITLKALRNAQITLRGGITAVRDCGGKDYLEFAVRDAIQRGTFAGPTIRAVGRMICMTGGHGNHIARVADGVDDVVRAVREQIHAGCDQIKIMATGGVMTPGVNPEDAHYSAEEMAAGVAEGKRFHRKAASHAQGGQGILNAARAGVASIEHGIFMTDECVEEMLRQKTALVPTLAAVNNILANADKGIPAYVVEKSQRVAERHRDSIRKFHRAGGTIAMGTDAGTPYNLHGENALELEYMVEVGIPARDALLSATRNAADLLDLPKQGRVEAGCDADLLVVQGDPVKDITFASRQEHHKAVFKHGRQITDVTL
jgi:imidazolonepropionase-like amidohydrolase